jgi:thioredoxin reductase (NADPH)
LSDATKAELVIVGAGPVGLYAAYYAGFRGLDTVVVEALPVVGGQISAFYPEATLYDVPGFPAVRGDELVRRLTEQASAFPLAMRLGEEVVALSPGAESVVLTTRVHGASAAATEATSTRSYETAFVLLAAGIGSFAPQRLRDDAIARYEGRGLVYHVDDAAGLRGRRVLVLGGTARAVDVAVALAGAGAAVELLHRRDRLSPPQARERLEAAGVAFLPFRELVGLSGVERVESALLEDRRDGRREEIAVDAVVPCYGYAADAASLRRLGLALEQDAALVDSHMATSLPRVYAAGDGATYPGKVRVLAADFGEACTAVNNIAARVVPGSSVFPGYSSHRGGAARRPRTSGTPGSQA